MLSQVLSWVFAGAVVALFVKWWVNRLTLVRIIDKIPGPHSLPVIGNLLGLLCSLEQLWINVRSWGERYYPIYRLWTGHVPTINLMCPQDIEIFLSTTSHSRKGDIYTALHPWLGTGLLTSEGSKWQSRRKILTPAFHFSILQQFLCVFVENCDVLLKKIEKRCDEPYININPLIIQFTLHSICETAMGCKLNPTKENQKEYENAIHRMGELVLYRIVRPWIFSDYTYAITQAGREQSRLVKILHSFSTSVIEDREVNFVEPTFVEDEDGGVYRSKRRLAMLDLLLSAKKAGAPIDNEGIREEVDTFMFEGHDTTAMSACFTLMLLANYSDVQEKVVEELSEIFGTSDRKATFQDLQEMNYVERVIKESLRLYPSVPFIQRITDEEVHTYTGYTIPAQSLISIHIYDMHRNAELYPEPNNFDPDRFLPENSQKRHPFAYLPFSAGPRNCIGQRFAFMELKSLISSVLRKFVLHPIDTPKSITLMPDLVLRSKRGIRIKFEPRTKLLQNK